MYICRGLPGSGKSTLARSYQQNPALICSADNYHINANGQYDWKPENVNRAHFMCKEYARLLMMYGFSPIVIDNTNIKRRDFEFYLLTAKDYGYKVIELAQDTSWAWDVDECFLRNTHRVPKETIQRMKDTFEP